MPVPAPHAEVMTAQVIIKLLTAASLTGLLFAVGLRLTAAQILDSLRQRRMAWIVAANFVLVPALTLVLTQVFGVPGPIAAGMILLGAAPFAPVVPVFTRMAKGDLALAAGLTALFPFLSALLTPAVCELSLKALPGTGILKFSFLSILVVLLLTITLPLLAGVAANHWLPKLGKALLRPMEVLSEATGAVSLAFVTIVEFKTIFATGWMPLLVMLLISELSLALGWFLGGPGKAARLVIGLGTSNRNIALALLIALQSFGDSPIVAAVVANGLVLILLGLLHVAYWRFVSPVPAALPSNETGN
jgi:BASS family bile acid:Na+ symporter